MRKKFIISFLCLALVSIVFSACAIKDSADVPQGKQVKLGPTIFIPDKITISKGQTVVLVNGSSPHTITNGTWKGSEPVHETQPGAPTVDLNFTGNETKVLGTFNTAGTFEIFCTIHGGMNLTVEVS